MGHVVATTPEGKVKQKVKAVLKKHGVWYFMPVPCGYGLAGVPDFICCVQGKFLGIETKAPGKAKSLTKHQAACHRAIRQSGGEVVVVDNADKIDIIIQTMIEGDGDGEAGRLRGSLCPNNSKKGGVG